MEKIDNLIYVNFFFYIILEIMMSTYYRIILNFKIYTVNIYIYNLSHN